MESGMEKLGDMAQGIEDRLVGEGWGVIHRIPLHDFLEVGFSKDSLKLILVLKKEGGRAILSTEANTSFERIESFVEAIVKP